MVVLDVAWWVAAGLRGREGTGGTAALEASEVMELDERRLECAGCRPSSCWRYKSFMLGSEADEEEWMDSSAVEGVGCGRLGAADK